jgi:hypothetical protein
VIDDRDCISELLANCVSLVRLDAEGDCVDELLGEGVRAADTETNPV